MAGQWTGSQRRTQLPPDWPARRQAALQRDAHQCTWTDPTPDGTRTRCTQRATDVDHRDRHGGHELDNLRALCHWHHARKTAAEGNAARRRLTARRPPEPHPGQLP